MREQLYGSCMASDGLRRDLSLHLDPGRSGTLLDVVF
jgi:hypothetical protein